MPPECIERVWDARVEEAEAEAEAEANGRGRARGRGRGRARVRMNAAPFAMWWIHRVVELYAVPRASRSTVEGDARLRADYRYASDTAAPSPWTMTLARLHAVDASKARWPPPPIGDDQDRLSASGAFAGDHPLPVYFDTMHYAVRASNHWLRVLTSQIEAGSKALYCVSKVAALRGSGAGSDTGSPVLGNVRWFKVGKTDNFRQRMKSGYGGVLNGEYADVHWAIAYPPRRLLPSCAHSRPRCCNVVTRCGCASSLREVLLISCAKASPTRKE